MLVGLARVPGIDGFTFDTEGLLGASVNRDEGAVKDHIRRSCGLDAVESLMEIRRPSCQGLDAFVDIAVARETR